MQASRVTDEAEKQAFSAPSLSGHGTVRSMQFRRILYLSRLLVQTSLCVGCVVVLRPDAILRDIDGGSWWCCVPRCRLMITPWRSQPMEDDEELWWICMCIAGRFSKCTEPRKHFKMP